MLRFQEFIDKWSNKPIDFDGVYPNQCMDLMHQYVYDVLGLTDATILAHPAAYQVFTDFTETQYFDKIANTPTGIPQKGDIILFNKTSSNPYGHVCIFIEGDANKFKSFDANYPTGSLPHIQDHTYGYCLGWLRPKAVTTMISVESATFENLVRKSSFWDSVCKKLNTGDSDTVVMAELDKLLKLEDALREKDKLLQEATAKIEQLQAQVKQLQQDHELLAARNEELIYKADDLVKQNDNLTKTAQDCYKTLGEQGTTIDTLQSELKALKQSTSSTGVRVYTGWRKMLIDFINKL